MIHDERQGLEEQTIQALKSEISAKDQAIKQQQAENRRLAKRLANAEAELARLKSGLTFRLLEKYHHTVNRFLPAASRRRQLYDTLMMDMHGLLMRGRPAPGLTSPFSAEKMREIEDGVIVYQMGKVGSSSIVSSVKYAYKQLGLTVPVYHVHNLNYPDDIEALVKAGGIPGVTLKAVRDDLALRKTIDQNPQRKRKVISLVREPVARNVAWFFQNLNDLVPEWRERWKNGSVSLEQLQEAFLSARQHDIPETWFHTEMMPIFGIDVYAEPFPREAGYKTYEGSPRASLLLIRLENLRECGPEVIRQFLGLDSFVLMNSNVGDDKEYAELYRAFKRLPLPRSYVDEIYGTRFAKHFYTEEEIARFTHNWTANDRGS